MSRLQLHGTPLSHFTRKVRILLGELGVAYDFMRLPGVLATSTALFAGNPLLRVPALVDGDVQVFESDHIARHVATRFDPADRFGVRSERVDDLNTLAVVNGVMANEVTLILAQRAGGVDMTAPYFGKLRAAIGSALAWLDARVDPGGFDYRDIALVCMWQHLSYYRLVDVDQYRALAARIARSAARPTVAATAPAASLAEAAAAGWTPG
jgi:glutathione S-transferase